VASELRQTLIPQGDEAVQIDTDIQCYSRQKVGTGGKLMEASISLESCEGEGTWMEVHRGSAPER
jgi:hypothetical protein